MTNFYIGDEFFRELEDYLIYMDLDEVELALLPETYQVQAEYAKLEPIFKATPGDMAEMLLSSNEHRLSEDGDEYIQVENALRKAVNFEVLNAGIPQLYYPTGEKFIITKQDLLKACE